MDSGGLFRAVADGALRRVSGVARALRGSTALAAGLLAGLAAAESAGQPAGLFREVAPAAAVRGPDFSAVSDAIALRRRLVAIDFGQLTPPAAAAAAPGAGAAPSGVLTLNLFDDASFTGLVRSVAPTFSGGYSLSGPLAGVEMGTMTLVVNGEVVAGSVRMPEATYRIRPAGAGLHAVSQVDPSSLPPLGEPIPGRGWEEEELPPIGSDGGFPAPVEPRLAPPVPAVFRATEDAPRAEVQGSIATDRVALEALYDATGGSNWTDNTNWKSSASLDEWFGVRTDAAGRVVAIELYQNGLSGPIPGDLGNLTNLERLWLLNNGLTGGIPDELGNLLNLWDLRLSGNELTGSIPGELGNLLNLQLLMLGANALSVGPMPAWLGNLVNLRMLHLDRSGVTGGIPAWLGTLTNLERLWLSENELTGGIPDELGNLNLEWLDLSSNDLSVGPIPVWLERLANLRGLDLSRSGRTGQIPAWFGSLTNLELLYLDGNELTGGIPDELGRLTNLQYVSLSNNDLTGGIPDELGSLTSLRLLSLWGNELTGGIPDELGKLTNLWGLYLSNNDLTGAIPAELGRLTNLGWLSLTANDLTGPIPSELGSLTNLRQLWLQYNWGLTGSLPAGLRSSPLERLGIFATQTCAPAVWQDWLATIDYFFGRLCGPGTDVTVDVAVVYTPAAREAAGGLAAIEAEIDLMVARTNQAYEASGVHHRVALVERTEVSYTETGDSLVDLDRLRDPSDGRMDGVHALRDRVGADLVHLVVGESDVGGRAYQPGAFSLGKRCCFAHELGHNMGLAHDRYEQSIERDWGGGVLTRHPAYGYVNQRAFEPGAPPSSCWVTIMAYGTQCDDEGLRAIGVPRFSNPRQQHAGEPLGVPWAADASAGVDGPADAASVLNATGPAVALWRDRPAGPNRPPTAVGTLPDRRVPNVGGTLDVDVSPAFADPDGDALTYTVSSSTPRVVSVLAAGARVALAALAEGTATIRVTASDPGGLTATQTFSVTVGRSSAPFTDAEIVPGVTPVRAVHFTELRTRIDGLRTAVGLGGFAWTDPVLTAGVTPVRLVHLLELRSALAAAYAEAGQVAPRWTDAAPVGGTTPIRAAHLMELRAAVLALE